jgi:hypothetical protein
VGISSDVVLDISGVALGGNVGSLAPVGISSDVPVPVVAFTKGKGTDIRNVAADINEIITMTPVCEEDLDSQTTISGLDALNFTRK